jgi:hypothetical protein
MKLQQSVRHPAPFEMLGLDSSAVAGHRALGQDYDTGGGASKFKWDVTMHGPLIGLVMRF